MAQVPYSPDSNVKADVNAPNDYEHLDVSPNQFGGLIAQGAEQFGAGASKLSAKWGEIQSDDAANNAQQEMSDVTDNFKKLRGQDALNAQAGVQAQIQAIHDKYQGQLGSPDQQDRFGNTVRPFMLKYIGGQINTHAETQGYAFASKTTSDGFSQALEMAANAGSTGDTGHIEVAKMKAQSAALKQVQLDGQESNPDAVKQAVAKANIGAYKSAAEAMAVKDPLGAQAFIEKHKDDLGIAYAPLADQVSARADKAQGFGLNNDASKAVTMGGWTPGAHTTEVSIGSPSPAGGPWAKAADGTPVATDRNGQAVPGIQPASVKTETLAAAPQQLSGDSAANAAGLLRGFEGFRTNAYWDVNHWRTGYGSDTITRADGSIEPVTATSTVTKADAERDLSRRIGQSQQQIQTAIGPDAWVKLSPQAQAALTSTTYNYGHLPAQLIGPAQSGNPIALASALRGLAGNNVNNSRRQQEAAAITGKFGLSGPVGTSTPQPTMTTPGGAPTPGASATPAAPDGAPIQNAAFTPPAAPQPTGPPANPDELLARKIQYVEQSGASDRVKAEAAQAAQNDYRMAALAAEANAKAVKDREDAVTNEYDGMMLKGQYPQAFAQLANDNRIPASKKLAIQEALEKRSGEPNPVAYGPKYTDIFNRVLAPSSDPNRIGDITELYRAEGAGDLTSKGTERLKTIMSDVRKNNDEYGLQRQVSLAYDYAKRHMVFEQNDGLGNLKITNPKGQDAYDLAFTQIFNNSFDAWKREGKDTSQFPYFQQKKLDELIQQVYPKRQADLDRLNGVDQNAPEAPNAPLPPPPQGIDPQRWTPVVSAAPPGITHAAWGTVLDKLASDPQGMVGAFNTSKYGRAGMRGEELLGRLGVPYAPPGKPEDVGAPTPSDMAAQPLPPEAPRAPEVVPPSALPPGSVGRGVAPRGPAAYRPDDTTGLSLSDLPPVIKRALESPRQRREEDEKK